MDVKPDNWLLITRMGSAKSDSDGVALGEKTHSMSLIDFGRAIDLSILDRNGSEVVFTGCCCASSFKSPAVIEVSDLAVRARADIITYFDWCDHTRIICRCYGQALCLDWMRVWVRAHYRFSRHNT